MQNGLIRLINNVKDSQIFVQFRNSSCHDLSALDYSMATLSDVVTGVNAEECVKIRSIKSLSLLPSCPYPAC